MNQVTAFYHETTITVVAENEGVKELKELNFIGVLTNKDCKEQLTDNETFVSKETKQKSLSFDLNKFKNLREKGEI